MSAKGDDLVACFVSISADYRSGGRAAVSDACTGSGRAERKEAADRGRAERRKRRSARGADLSAQTNRETYLHRTLYYAPCGHSVQRREKLPAQLVGLTRSALEKEIGGLYENAAVTGFSAGEVDITTRMDMPCPLHWVLRGGEDGLLAVWQNTTGEALSVVRKTDIPVTAAAEEEQDELRDGRMFDDVQALEGYLESLSS